MPTSPAARPRSRSRTTRLRCSRSSTNVAHHAGRGHRHQAEPAALEAPGDDPRSQREVQAAIKGDQLAAFADPGLALLGANGQPRPEFYQANGLNLNEAGYVAWTAAVRPVIERRRW